MIFYLDVWQHHKTYSFHDFHKGGEWPLPSSVKYPFFATINIIYIDPKCLSWFINHVCQDKDSINMEENSIITVIFSKHFPQYPWSAPFPSSVSRTLRLTYLLLLMNDILKLNKMWHWDGPDDDCFYWHKKKGDGVIYLLVRVQILTNTTCI